MRLDDGPIQANGCKNLVCKHVIALDILLLFSALWPSRVVALLPDGSACKVNSSNQVGIVEEESIVVEAQNVLIPLLGIRIKRNANRPWATAYHLP
jgi:hypothetical protein